MLNNQLKEVNSHNILALSMYMAKSKQKHMYIV